MFRDHECRRFWRHDHGRTRAARLVRARRRPTSCCSNLAPMTCCGGVSPEVTERNLTAMIERLQGRDIEIVLMGMLAAPNLGSTFRDAFEGGGIFPAWPRPMACRSIPYFSTAWQRGRL